MRRTFCYAILAMFCLTLVRGSAPAQSKPFAPPIAPDELRRGLESVIRAASQKSSSGSGGAPSPGVDIESAKSMNLDNQIKATKTYFQKRQLNRQYRAAERGPRRSNADLVRYARDAAPDRLSSSQYDSFRGRINWPIVLRTDVYKNVRAKVEALYAKHVAAGGGINTAQYAEIKRLTLAMQEHLKKNIKNITTEQYMYARKFLESLRSEARYPAGS